MNGEPKAIERTEKDRGITTSVPAYQRIENSNVILPQQSAGNLAIQRQSQREQLEEAPGRWTTCVVSHHQPSTAQREPPPPPGKWDELRRFVEANAPGRPFPPPRKPTGQPIEVAVTQDVSVPSPGGKPR